MSPVEGKGCSSLFTDRVFFYRLLFIGVRFIGVPFIGSQAGGSCGYMQNKLTAPHSGPSL